MEVWSSHIAMTLVDIAQMVSGLGAAVAAIAALMSVRQAADMQRRGRWPHLTAMPQFDSQTRRMRLEIHNAGLGIASSTQFAVVVGDQIAEGVVGGTFIKPGQNLDVRTMIEMTAAQEAARVRPYGALWCADTAGTVHVFALDGEHTHWKPKKRRRSERAREPGSCREALAVACPGQPDAPVLSDRAYGCLLYDTPAVFREEHKASKPDLFPEHYRSSEQS